MQFPVLYLLVIVAAGIVRCVPALRQSGWAGTTVFALLGVFFTVDVALQPFLLVSVWPVVVILWVSIVWAVAVDLAFRDFSNVALRHGLEELPSRQMMTALPGLLVTVPIGALMMLVSGLTYPAGVAAANAAIGINSAPSTVRYMLVVIPAAALMVGSVALGIRLARRRDPWYETKLGLVNVAVARGARRTELLDRLVALAPRV